MAARPGPVVMEGGGGEEAWRRLSWAAVLYGLAWALHTGDHLRRGGGVLSTGTLVLGYIAAVLQLAAVAGVLTRRRWAPMAAVAIGFPHALGIAAVHLLPHWSSLSDAFPGAHGTGVTALSGVAALLEIGGALIFGLAGLSVLRRHDPVAVR